MARGDQRVETIGFGAGAEILNRPPYKAVPMTIDFTNVTTTDPVSGRKIVKAGTPIDKDGVPVTASPWSGALGILFLDAEEGQYNGQILTEAYINVTWAQNNSGLTYDGALVNAMNNAGNRIRFEEPNLVFEQE